MLKAELRSEMKLYKRSVLCDRLLNHTLQSLWPHFTHVLAYAAMAHEPELNWPKRCCYFPRISQSCMCFHRAAVTELQQTAWGPQQPPQDAPVWQGETSTCLLVPALAFSLTGHRLGFGSGYYDRFLARHRHQLALVLGVGYAWQLRHFVPEAHDQPMQRLLIAHAPTSVRWYL